MDPCVTRSRFELWYHIMLRRVSLEEHSFSCLDKQWCGLLGMTEFVLHTDHVEVNRQLLTFRNLSAVKS